MQTLFKDKFVMIGTDGGGGGLHPRGHGSFARVIKKLVREEELVPLEEAVRKMAALPAETLGMRDRGVLEPGRAADIAVFDPAAVEDTASFLRPHTAAKGMTAVLVNGEVAYRTGKPTAARAGLALRKKAD
jgi:N-acyl-D-aspartate/D-glutamate deacylase